MAKPPKYSIWEAINAALSTGMKALTEVRQLARVPGPPGKDGMGFDDMTIEQRDERNFAFVFRRGGTTKEFVFSIPVMIDRGVYREGNSYARGDTVTWGGSMWTCTEPTVEKPDGGKGWRLSVKRGRDGKDAK